MQEIPYPDPPVTDGEITLRAKRDDDIDALVAALQDPEIPRWTRVPVPYTHDTAREWYVKSEEQRRAGEHLNLLLVDAHSDALLGSLGLMQDPALPGVGEIGYWIAKERRGEGLCARAVTLLRDWAVESLGLHRFELLIDIGNVTSQRAALKCGFVDTGELRVAPRTEGATELTHRVYAWEPTSAE